MPAPKTDLSHGACAACSIGAPERWPDEVVPPDEKSLGAWKSTRTRAHCRHLTCSGSSWSTCNQSDFEHSVSTSPDSIRSPSLQEVPFLGQRLSSGSGSVKVDS